MPRAVPVAAILLIVGLNPGPLAAQTSGPFDDFTLPEDWQRQFWADASVQAVLAMEPKAVAALVPVQAGLRYCRCPACDASEADDPLAWSPSKPDVVTCRRCGVELPNDKFPAKVPPAPGQPPGIPEETVEVLPRVVHKYPYHVVEPLKQAYPEERLYLAAKRDYEAREFLSKLALYAAVRHRTAVGAEGDPACARLAAVLILRFAQVYPAYATHYDQPGQPKFFQPADLKPPYRRGYRTAKWDWTGCLDVPMNLLIAYALVRDDPALAEAGRWLEDPSPSRTIERDLFRASAEFVRLQPEEYNESSLYAYRGMLAVGRLLGDDALIRGALARLDDFTERGFYHDGLWRQGDPAAHRRVVGLIDGWLDRLLAGYRGPNSLAARSGTPAREVGAGARPLVELARRAGDAALIDALVPEVQRVGWPSSPLPTGPRRPMLLGGAGLARLAVGDGADALDVELRGMGGPGSGHDHRLTLRLAVGGRVVLGDLDGQAPTGRGFERASVAHNTVVVDGLNHRETIESAKRAAPGSDILFFAADPDFQVATFADRYAYPASATQFRQTVVASSGRGGTYAVSVVEILGGLQHDQLYHAPSGSQALWRLSANTRPGPATLLPASIPFLPTAEAEDGRWFVQSYGEFRDLASALMERPSQAVLSDGRGPGVRLHLLGDLPAWVVSARSTDPTAATGGRASLVLRRRSEDGSTLETRFVTLFEPLGGTTSLKRVGRLEGPEETVVLVLESATGTEHLVLNFTPGTEREVALLDGRRLRTDGLAVRVSDNGLTLAGGTFAETEGLRVEQPRATGTIRAGGREGVSAPGALGWFETVEAIDDPEALAGRTLIVRHGDGTSRGWTVVQAENRANGGGLIQVREVPGFRVEPGSGEAVYVQFPRTRSPGPHRYSVGRIARSGAEPASRIAQGP